jgi:glycosyltransferase involved in cell wall biosynthesis
MNLPRVVFLDQTCPKPYDYNSLLSEPLGGTEATVIRVAEGLAATGRYEVVVAQHNRTSTGEGKAVYTSFEALDQIYTDPKVAIVLRNPTLIPVARSRWSNTKFHLWLHDFNQQDVVRHAGALEGINIICVSKGHKTVVNDSILTQVRDPKFRTSYIYNPIDDELAPDSTEVIHRRLVFFSSPHKGLDHTLKVFEQIKRKDNYFELIIANPGYLPGPADLPERVRSVGSLTHAEMMKLLRSSLCVLHLNAVFPETFGLVHAEANAVGTPVLTSHFGANSEILRPAYEQMIDVRNETAVVDRIMKWVEQGRPAVQGRPEFKLSNVISKWEALINA